ncbi:HpcH/HpaI aldolase/citrate lyase family protein [Nocardiopsis suaedae]|uniref:CoA ester lyase n=1 Tax=Nocardiopsis suaedae TaxID=3018444 RepID=A0ABT4TKK9_9ACTN|nr:CoA ester lyase [Nocardiopsis suaedae]MDA2805207.1 CoA ester lyase [Nocardiopsis suaedae]
MAPFRSRRSVLAVPASNPRFVDKARGIASDAFFLDLEDAVAPSEKERARDAAAAALTEGGWGARVRTVRVNALDTPWTYRDVATVVERAGAGLDCLVLPKVTEPLHVQWLDLLLTQVERACGLEAGRIGIEAQIEDARGLSAVDAIAAASPRLETLVYGPADFMASVNIRSLEVGAQPPGYDAGDAYHYVLFRILTAARANGLQAIDGPELKVRDPEAFRASAGRTAALGYDGKWTVHPSQVEAANGIYSPGQEEFDRAERILDAYEHATSVERRGAVTLDGEMLDEASRKMALVVSAKGRAAGLARSSPPDA